MPIFGTITSDGSTITYSNRYGTLELEVMGPYSKISSMRSSDWPVSCRCGIDEAEKVVLITDNRKMQMALCDTSLKGDCFVPLHHISPSEAAVCRIKSMAFAKGVNATKELVPPNPYAGPIPC